MQLFDKRIAASATVILMTAAGLLAGCDGASSTSATTHPVPGQSAAQPGDGTNTLLPTPRESADETTAVGALVAGFPTDLIPVPEGAQILLTTNAPQSATLRVVSLSAKVPAAQTTSEQLLTIYRTSLTTAGFVEQPAQGATGVTASATFVRGSQGEIVTVTIMADGDQLNITVGGTVAITAPAG